MTALPDPSPAGPPIGTDSFVQPRRAAFWLLMLLIAQGSWDMARTFALGFAVVPATVLFGLLAWGMYTALFLWVLHRFELLEPLPDTALVLAFAWGGLGAAFLAIPSNAAILSLCAKLVSPDFALRWGAALAGPTVEEPLKLAGVVLLVLVARNQFRTPLPVLAAGAVVGLGFQVVENFSYSVNASLVFPRDEQIEPVLLNLFARGLVGGLWSHAAYSTVAAMGVAWCLLQTRRPMWQRAGGGAGCLLLAWALHFFWNAPLVDAVLQWPGGRLLWLLVKGVPVMAAAWLFWHAATREEGRQLRALADHFVPERELISDSERRRLGSPLQRLMARRYLRNRYGMKAGRLKWHLQRAQLRLLRRVAVRGRGPRTARLEARIRALRARLEALRAG